MTIPAAARIHKNIYGMLFLAAFILIAAHFVLAAVPVVKRDVVATGLLADIIITFPLAYYFLIIRPFKQKSRQILLVISICLFVAYLVLPPHQQYYVLQLRKISALAEFVFLVYIAARLRQIVRYYQKYDAGYQDFAHQFSNSMIAVLGNSLSVRFVATEITILRFGLGFWKSFRSEPGQIKRYSVYKNSGYASLFGVMLFLAAIDILVVHAVINHYNHSAAVIVSILSFYGMIFLVGDFSAVVKSPILFLPGKILFRTGFRWRALVNINNIASVEKITESYQPEKNCFRGSILKSSGNILVTFKHPVCIDRVYREAVEASKIIISIDEPEAFIISLQTPG